MKAATLALLGGPRAGGNIKYGPWPVIGEQERAAVARVLDRGVLSGGNAPEASALQEEFADYVGAKYCLMAHSGTSALQLALACAGVVPGDEVIVPAYTFVATAMAVVLQGATPVFVDVQPLSGNMDPALLEAVVTSKTRVIMPVHVHGCPADLDEIGAVAQRHSLVVVEDAAQAHGATYKGRAVGALFAAGGFSLQSSKNLVGGEGGLFVTNSRDAAEHAERVRNFGQNCELGTASSFRPERPLDGAPLVSTMPGSMYRGNELAAAFTRAQLGQLKARTAESQRHARWLCARLAQLPGVIPPPLPSDRESVHHKFRVHFDLAAAGCDGVSPLGFRRELLAALNAEGLEVVLWQDTPVPAMPLFRSANERRFPVAQALLESSVVLFSQSHPLIGQSEATIQAYADAFEKVWESRDILCDRARKQ